MKYFCRCLAISGLLVASIECDAQGTLQITFDGPPSVPANSGMLVQSYSESGMWFMPISGTDGFVRWGGGDPRRPEDGTAYIQCTIGDSLSFGFDNGSDFGLTSIDLAGYSTSVPDVTAYFTGYRADGSTVSTSIQTSGTTFKTYYFGAEWSDLTRVEIPDFGSLDNLVVAVPEPSVGALFVLGLLGFQFKRRKLS